MTIEIVQCPVCGQRLALQSYVVTGVDVVCANPTCLTTLRLESRSPVRVSVIPTEQTHNANARPESYG